MDSAVSKDALAGTSRAMRAVEVTSVIVFVALISETFYFYMTHFGWNWWHVTSASLISLCVGDFFSGMVHWSADTWGSVHWPVIGPSLIRSFREHHVDALAITRHDFVETNGATAMLLVPALFGVRSLLPNIESNWAVWSTLLSLFSCISIFLTNQFHKWAHSGRVHTVVGVLQKGGLIISPSKHAVHHRGEFDISYCITTGWLNPILNGFGYFRILERSITAMTGVYPREDDKVIIAAIKASEHPVPSATASATILATDDKAKISKAQRQVAL